MTNLISVLLQPCLIQFLNSLRLSDDNRLGWQYGSCGIVIEHEGRSITNLSQTSIPEDDWVDLVVLDASAMYRTAILDVSDPFDWTAHKLKSLIMEHTNMSVETVATAYFSGKTDFYRRSGPVGFVKCDKASATWVSLPAEMAPRHLPMGYPLSFVELELSTRGREFAHRTPDMCESVDEFLRFYREGMVEESMTNEYIDWEHGFYSKTKQRTIVVDNVRYSVEEEDTFHEEGVIRKAKWMKDGVLHRLSGSAEAVFNKPGIPSEGHLAKDCESWYVNGEFVRAEDKTEETIVSTWSSSQKEYFGYFDSTDEDNIQATQTLAIAAVNHQPVDVVR